MPKINIYDEDLTTAVRSINTEYAVYVPGLCNLQEDSDTKPLKAEDGPTLFENLASFYSRVGVSPALLQNEKPDKSFIYACELLGAGLPVVYQVIADPSSWVGTTGDQAFYDYSEAEICALIGDSGFDMSGALDKGAFDISFVTTGGYPTIYNIGSDSTVITLGSNAKKLMKIATERGDCFALIDVTDEVELHSADDLEDIDGIIKDTGLDSRDAFIIVPGCEETPSFSNYKTAIVMPGSFKYLTKFASSIRTNASWFAVAGAKRGTVGGNPAYVITNDEADALQPDEGISVNAITKIRPYGNCIWGNRTLLSNTGNPVASSYINVRQLVHDIKRHLYKTAKALMFSPNDDVLWVNFKNNVSPLLDKMLSGQGISSYRLVKVTSTARATLAAKIVITPIEAVEAFELTVVLTDAEVTTEG